MKQLFFMAAAIVISVSAIAQGKGKAKGHGNKHQQIPGTGSSGNAGHQPKKVTEAFYRDYPAASNVVWSKYKGDYTASFNNGIWRSTAVYHANGARRDTRTVLTRQQLPGSVWDQIFKRDNVIPVEYTQIERPGIAESIFRILTQAGTAYFYNANGGRVNYDY